MLVSPTRNAAGMATPTLGPLARASIVTPRAAEPMMTWRRWTSFLLAMTSALIHATWDRLRSRGGGVVPVSQLLVVGVERPPPGQPGNGTGDHPDHGGNVGGGNLPLVAPQEQRQFQEAGELAALRVLFAGHCRTDDEHRVHFERRPGFDMDLGRDAPGVGEVVHRSRRHRHGFPWPRGQAPAADPEAHLTGHHTEAFLLLGVRVAARYSPAGGKLEIPDEQS